MTDARDARYAEQLGTEALQRQQRLAKDYHKCCGEHRLGPHHETCKHYRPDAPPPVIPGQETLV